MIGVSIIIPVYNTKKYLQRCLNSCVSQTLKNIEIIVVDDASPDGVRPFILEYAKKYPDLIKPILLEKNLGHSSACNCGLKSAKGEYVLFCDSDDWLECDACEKLWTEAKRCGADLVGGDLFLNTDQQEMLTHRNYLSTTRGGG